MTIKSFCYWIGHKWKYNFKYLASKRCCIRCGKTQRAEYGVGHPKDIQRWKDVDLGNSFNKLKQNL